MSIPIVLIDSSATPILNERGKERKKNKISVTTRESSPLMLEYYLFGMGRMAGPNNKMVMLVLSQLNYSVVVD